MINLSSAFLIPMHNQFPLKCANIVYFSGIVMFTITF